MCGNWPRLYLQRRVRIACVGSSVPRHNCNHSAVSFAAIMAEVCQEKESCFYWSTRYRLGCSELSNVILCISGVFFSLHSENCCEWICPIRVCLFKLCATTLPFVISPCVALWNCLWLGSWRVLPSCFIYVSSSLQLALLPLFPLSPQSLETKGNSE